jgi:hypothetical protein
MVHATPGIFSRTAPFRPASAGQTAESLKKPPVDAENTRLPEK